MRTMRAAQFAVMMLVAVALVAPAQAGDSTVGQFVLKVAQSQGLTANSPESAFTALSASGFQLPAGTRLADPLTEETLVRLARPLDLRLSSSRPDAVVNEQMLTRFFDVFGPEFDTGSSTHGGRGGSGGDSNADNDGTVPDGYAKGKGNGKGKGWAKGHGKGKGKGKGSKTECDPN